MEPAQLVVWAVVKVRTTGKPSWGERGNPPLPPRTQKSTVDTAPNSHLYYQVGVGIPDTPVCASQALGKMPSFLRETSSLLRGSQVGGGCGDIGVHSLTGEKAVSITQILPKPAELALEMLSNLEQGGYIQQGVFNVLPQPVRVLQRSR